jgi:transcription-repair coupling factor (superfamily II helicase)
MNAPEPAASPGWWAPAVRKTAARLLPSWFQASPAVRLGDMPASALAFIAWGIRETLRAPVLFVTDGPVSLDESLRDLRTLAPDPTAPVLFFPPLESATGDGKSAPPPELTGARLTTLASLDKNDRPIVATCVQALMQPTISPAELSRRVRRIVTGETHEMADLVHFLEQSGFRFEPEVHEPGEATVRGGLIDAWPPTEEWPLRIEFFGSTVESIRQFEPDTQASRAVLRTAYLAPVSEQAGHSSGPAVSLLALLPPETVVVWFDYPAIENMAEVFEETVRERKSGSLAIPLEELNQLVLTRLRREVRSGMFDGVEALDVVPLPSVVSLTRDTFRPDLAEQQRHAFLLRLAALAGEGRNVFLFFETEGALHRFLETASDEIRHVITPRLAILSEGFTSETFGLVLASESDLYGRRKQTRGRLRLEGVKKQAGSRIGDFSEIQPGDLVVHIDHGIGRYRGLGEIEVAGQKQEALILEYAEGARLHVPVDHAHLLTRYVGMGKHSVKLHALGGRRWQTERKSVEKAVQDLAANMLETQAARDLQAGHAFKPDNPWQHEFEAAFPYRETEDQVSSIADVKKDMESSRPMDRLICGDAGYGKTEVAMRAAFKAVMDGRQVAVLVPTTVLAQQHFYTFAERMSAFPIRIEMYSRMCTAEQRIGVMKGLADGSIDIVIGTHGLLEPSMTYTDLGLVIVDEEQRFGVAHKERLKSMRRLVDVLTLTATPIPRTLYMSLTGVRDLSLIQTPPSERLPVETVVAENKDDVVREAILRELSRGGQIYYLHNRVHTIEAVRQRLEHIVPEARITVAHGQMPPRQLSQIMQEFVTGGSDVLLCTTIVESGTDIPNANTILIERADRFGMSDLYQLRGRAGRSKARGYCYMLLPKNGLVDPSAKKRIQALRQHSGLGAGFKLAMRDLEIRGSGNILGHEQSGHIAAVGFSLYCQLLRRTVERLKGKESSIPLVDVQMHLDFVVFSPDQADRENAAIIPSSYLDDEALKISQYRQIASTWTVNEVNALRRKMRDRFGPIPDPVERLFLMSEIRILGAQKKLVGITTRDDRILLSKPGGDLVQFQNRLPRFKAAGCTARLLELKALLKKME